VAAAHLGLESVCLGVLSTHPNVIATSRSFGFALVRAAMGGHYNIVRHLLDCDVESRSPWSHESAVQGAAESGQLDILRLLMDRSCGVDCREDLLHYAAASAAEGGHLDVIAFLKSAWTTPPVSLENEILRGGASGGHVLVVESALANGAAVHAVDSRGRLQFGICKIDANAWHYFLFFYCLRLHPNYE